MRIKSHYFINGLSILLSIWILWMLSQRFIPRSSAAPNIPAALLKGTPVSLRGIDWAHNGETLLLFLSPSCRYCTKSAPFYSALSERRSDVFQMVAVFETDPATSKEYLMQHNINNTAVEQAMFTPLSISSTPTLVLADHNGRVDKTWIGYLDAAERADLLGRIGLQEAPDSTETKITLADTAAPTADLHLTTAPAYIDQGRARPDVLDTRDARLYRKGHLKGAKNIPMDEFETRIPHELKPQQPVALFCQYCGPCENSRYAQGVFTPCTFARHILNRLGYTKIEIITDDLDIFKADGEPVIVER